MIVPVTQVASSMLPFIFIASGDEGEKYEPAGRRVFTLALLAVLVARGTFATVSYKDHTSNETTFREWEITASIRLMRQLFGGRMHPLTIEGLDAAMRELVR